jgi:hypothetical protein
MNARDEFTQMEQRQGGGGAGGCIALIFIVLIPLIGLIWAFWPATVIVKPKAAAAETIFEPEQPVTVPGMGYTLFPNDPAWSELQLEIRPFRPTKILEII